MGTPARNPKGNPVLARIDCACSERGAVYQNTRDYLYTRTPTCRCEPPKKCDQDSSAARQVFVWQHMEPLPGAVIKRPLNVPADLGEPGAALRGPVPAVVVEKPAAAPIGQAADIDLNTAGQRPAKTPEKAEENPQKAAAADLPPRPAKTPADDPIGAGKKGPSAGLVFGITTLLSLLAAVFVGMSSSKPGNTTDTSNGSAKP